MPFTCVLEKGRNNQKREEYRVNWYKTAQALQEMLQEEESLSPSSYRVVCDTPAKTARKMKQLAYLVNNVDWTIILSTSGHATLQRDHVRGTGGGGWIFPLQQKISYYSGTAGHVKNTEAVKSALENYLGIYFRAM